jgi:hypothetical protein
MNDKQTTNQVGQNERQTGPGQQPGGDPWQEVGKQFQILGESLAAAFRASVDDPQHRRRLHEMRGGLENMIRDVDKAITDAASSPQADQARGDAQRAAETLRSASEQTVQEIRPRLVAALKQVNEELQKFADRLEQDSAKRTPPPADNDPKP